ncbi:FluC/FEX family fluoride channel [Solicola sp. PLA-1-18]|uniref:FluC/FEX family fluoride channel n=1 Tax=Solicola sp. PLA-1-18 TaxID=3380532 RepID=UPI003B7D1AF2
MSTRTTVALVALGGALGALARWASPWPTLVTNVLGCLVMGALVVALERRMPGRWARPLLAVGFLGGYTTFSAYTVDVARPLVDGDAGDALVHLVATPVAAVLAVAVGVLVARRLVPARDGT